MLSQLFKSVSEKEITSGSRSKVSERKGLHIPGAQVTDLQAKAKKNV